jgi:hypothetical protein
LIRIAAVAILVPIACLAAYVPIQQHLLRWRAERLLADIRQIQMGKSTWADAQAFMTKWGTWGGYEGVCTTERCDYRVAMQDWFRGMPAYFSDGRRIKLFLEKRAGLAWFKPFYRLLGGRFAVVQAEIKVRNGIIWTKSFAVEIATAPEVYNPKNDSATGSEPLVADAEGVTHFQGSFDFVPTHPEHTVYADGCTGCVLASAFFTPRTDAGTMSKIFDINLGCLTRLLECKEQEQIMPEVYRLASAERERPPSKVFNDSSCQIPLELTARDAHYVAIGEVASIAEKHSSDERVPVASFRSLERLKNHAYVGPLLFRDDLALRPETILPGGIPASKLRVGDKIIMLFDAGPDEPDVVPLEDACSFVPYSPESLAAVQRGIALDAIPNRY